MQTGPKNAGPRKGSFLSDPEVAGLDLRKACNVVKRAANVAAAALAEKVQPEHVSSFVDKVAVGVLEGLGIVDFNRSAAILPMALDATTVVVCDAIRFGDVDLSPEKVSPTVDAILSVLKMKAVAKMSDDMWVGDMDAGITARMAATSALAVVSVEVQGFDFYAGAATAMKLASTEIVSACLEMVNDLSPAAASARDKLIFFQSLIRSTATVYAACWHAEAKRVFEELQAQTPAQAEIAANDLRKGGYGQCIATVESNFRVQMAALKDCAVVNFDSPIPAKATVPASAVDAPTVRTRRFRNS